MVVSLSCVSLPLALVARCLGSCGHMADPHPGVVFPAFLLLSADDILRPGSTLSASECESEWGGGNRGPQGFEPKIHMTDSDFMSLTDNGAMCRADGGLGREGFELLMREQVSGPPPPAEVERTPL